MIPTKEELRKIIERQSRRALVFPDLQTLLDVAQAFLNDELGAVGKIPKQKINGMKIATRVLKHTVKKDKNKIWSKPKNREIPKKGVLKWQNTERNQ